MTGILTSVSAPALDRASAGAAVSYEDLVQSTWAPLRPDGEAGELAESAATMDGLFARASGISTAPRWLAQILLKYVFTARGQNEK